MKINAFLILILFILYTLWGCKNTEPEPELNFELLWEAFNENYPSFEQRNINWDSIYNLYRPQVSQTTNSKELFRLMSTMLDHLNDKHVSLWAGEAWNGKWNYHSGYGMDALSKFKYQTYFTRLEKSTSFKKSLIKRKYLHNNFYTAQKGTFIYGWLSDSIAYLHFNKIANENEAKSIIDDFLKKTSRAQGYIIDIRNNWGGDSGPARHLANRLADKPRLYLISKKRKCGPDHSSFYNPVLWQIVPDKNYKKIESPVVLLVNKITISAGEIFTLMMNTLPNVVIVGDTTAGALADCTFGKLPNGWSYQLPNKLNLNYLGECFEGTGIKPDIPVSNSKANINKKIDDQLETAIEAIKNNTKIIKENYSDKLARISLSDTLETLLSEMEINEALTLVYPGDNSFGFLINIHKINRLAEKLWNKGMKKEAIEVYKINVKEYYERYWTHYRLGQAYERIGNIDYAIECYKQALRMLPYDSRWLKSINGEIYEDISQKTDSIKILRGF